MAEPPPYPGRPRWVKAALLMAALAAVLLVLLMVLGGGRHGPGRHLPSGSMFLYYLDPDGLTIEYTFGMEEFPELEPRQPRVLPPVPESNDIWASRLDPRKASVGAIEQLPLSSTSP